MMLPFLFLPAKLNSFRPWTLERLFEQTRGSVRAFILASNVTSLSLRTPKKKLLKTFTKHDEIELLVTTPDLYQNWMEEQAQSLIDATTAAFKAGKLGPGGPPGHHGAMIPPPMGMGGQRMGMPGMATALRK